MIENFDELLARCQAARRRRLFRISLMIGGVFLLIGGSVIGYLRLSPPKSHEHPPTTAPSHPQPAPLPLVDQNTTDSNETIEPLSGFESFHPIAHTPKPKIRKAEPEEPLEQTDAPLFSQTAQVPSIPPESSPLFQVDSRPAQTPVDLYYNTPSYDTAMAAARDFYAKENYLEASIWAKKANRINPEAEESWLLYAKSLRAQGRE